MRVVFSILCCQVQLCLYFITGMKKWKILYEFMTWTPTRQLTCCCQLSSPSPVGPLFLTDNLAGWYGAASRYFVCRQLKHSSEKWDVYFNILRLFVVQDLNMLFSEQFSALHHSPLYSYLYYTVSKNAEMYSGDSFWNQNNLKVIYFTLWTHKQLY